jgi:hypothetical protein
MIIEFGADKLKVYGPKSDGGYTITFETGEYEQIKIAELLKIPQQTTMKVKVEVKDSE